MFTFVSNKPCGQVLDISPKNVTFLKIFKLEFSYIAVWFTDQKSKPYSLCLGNISKDLHSIVRKKTGLNGYVYNFYVDYQYS